MPPFTLRTVTTQVRRETLTTELARAEQEYIRVEARLKGSLDELEQNGLKANLEAIKGAVKSLQADLDALPDNE